MESNSNKYDVIVVGSGPGGYVAAIRAAQLGLKTSVVERDKVGGICLNWGCIPTKALLETARLLDEMRRADEFGLVCQDPQPDWQKIVKRSRAAADKMSKGVEYLLKKNKIDVHPGFASFESPNTLRVAPPPAPPQAGGKKGSAISLKQGTSSSLPERVLAPCRASCSIRRTLSGITKQWCCQRYPGGC